MAMNIEKKTSLKVSLFILIVVFSFSAAYYINWHEVDEGGKNEINTIFAESNNAYFNPVLPGYPLAFPKDYREHPNFQHEQWMMTVNGISSTGDTIGIQWTIFRISSDDRETKGWLDPKLYIAKVVVTTEDGKWVGERVARGGIGQAGISQRPYRVWIDDWQWRSLGRTPFPAVVTAGAKDFSIKLSINQEGPVIPLGEQGYSKKHDLMPIASYEYMAPFLAVRGNVTLDNKVYSFVGKGILEHEWGSGLLDENQQGWDWFIINLNKDSKLLVIQYRHQGQEPYRYGSLLYKNGSHVPLTSNEISFQTLPARQLKDGRKLPLQWIINIPKYDINLTTQVVRDEQWLNTLIPYWQGPITTSGSHEVTGFMQLTGY